MSVAKGFRLSDDSTAKLDWNYVTKPDGAKSIIEEVNDVKQDLNYVELDIYGYSYYEVEQGSVNTNTGVISDSTNYVRTTKTAIIPNKTYTMNATNNGSARLSCVAVYYTESGAYLTSATVGWVATGTGVYTFTTPSNAKYMRLRFSYYPVATITPSTISVNITQEEAWKQVVDNSLAEALQNKGVITASGLDLNTGQFIKSGSWAIADVQYIPDNYPSDKIGRIVSIATTSDSSYSTIQIVVDNTDTVFVRYSNANGSWIGWKQVASYDNITYVVQNTMFNYGNITTSGLDLNKGNFIHPGVWAVNDAQYLPYHSPTNTRCRIISFASASDNTIYTYQIVIDANGKTYKRFSTNTSNWTPWTSETALHDSIAFKCLFIDNETFINNNIITYDSSSSNRVQTLMEKWDAVQLATGVSLTKQTLGKDASNAYDIYNYKVSNGVTGKPVVLVVFGEHGNEANSAEIGSYFYKEVANGVLTKYLKYVDFWLIPLMNPWGYENKARNNYNDVNLNRDFPCEWNYYVVQHNKTGNYSLSQVETQYLYNLLVNNRNKILFMVNKHNTGSISTKININEEDIVGYTATVLKSDTIFNEGLTMWQDAQIHETDPWIITECDTDISSLPLIVNRANLVTDGSMDLFANSIGIHGSLLEVCGASTYSTDSPAQYSDAHYQDLARLELDFIVNYVTKAIENNELLLSNDALQMRLVYRTRTQDGSATSLGLTWEQGSINTNTGAESESTQRCRSSYGSVSGNTRNVDLTFTNNGSETMGLVAVYYDSNHDFLSSDTGLGSVSANSTTTFSITPPNGASYIRFRVQYGSLATITPSNFSASAELSAWKNIEQYWNGNTLVNIQ